MQKALNLSLDRMQKAQRASFGSKHEEETYRFLVLIHKIKGELIP